MLEQTSAIWIAAIVAVPTVLSTTIVPLWLKYLENQTRREERAEDLARLTLTADKAEQVAKQAETAAVLLVTNTAAVAKAAATTNEKLVEVAKVTGVIHTLVNSQLTAAKQSEFDANTRLIEVLRALPQTDQIIREIKKLEVTLAELAAVLADRMGAAKVVAIQESK